MLENKTLYVVYIFILDTICSMSGMSGLLFYVNKNLLRR